MAQTNQNTAIAMTHINLMGAASGKYTPDQATFDFNIVTRNKDSQEAMSQLQVASEKLINRLKKLGFSKEQIALQGYNLNQEYDYPDGRQVMRGYIAQQSLHLAFTWDYKKLDQLFKSFANDGSPELSYHYGTNFSDSLKSTIQKELIVKAMRDAELKAQLITQAAQLTINGIKDINYNFTAPPPMMAYRSDMMMLKAAEASGMPDVNVQQQEFSEQIGIVYTAIKK